MITHELGGQGLIWERHAPTTAPVFIVLVHLLVSIRRKEVGVMGGELLFKSVMIPGGRKIHWPRD